MLLPRVIPVLLLKNKGLVKTVNFKNSKYVGDPINAVKIFNEKEVDEEEQNEGWYEVYGLSRKDLSAIEPNEMLRIPGHIFLKF